MENENIGQSLPDHFNLVNRSTFHRRLPVGAEVQPQGGAHFRVYAPKWRRVEVVLEDVGGEEQKSVALQSEDAENSGYFSGLVKEAAARTRYRFRRDGSERTFPDPASRFQPDGPHGPSQVVDPASFRWSDEEWRGVGREGQVIYEMHVGTFTRAGTWAAAAAELPELADLGVTVIEMMPVADFPGRFGWGYDGVNLFAPTRLYGEPDDLRRFIDRAHVLGMGLILDVVYNHLGPDGNYLREFADNYFTDRYHTDWGDPINFDGEDAAPVREYFLANAAYWVDEFHFDGFRLDATQNIYDQSGNHIFAALTRRVREAARGRATYIVAENEPQHVRLVQPIQQGGYGMDALWNDDFHHSAMVAMTGRNEAYYSDYLGSPQEFVSAAKYGYLYQGQWYKWQEQRRGTPGLRLGPPSFVAFLQNHDQIANSGRGERCYLLTSPGRFRAMTALLLLGPATPMLFQGQEFGASSPFFYFADFEGELGRLMCQGRGKELSQFPSLATPATQAVLHDPCDWQTFELSKLNFGEREKNAAIYQMHKDLLRLRREDPVFSQMQRCSTDGHPAGCLDGAVLGPEAFVLRFFGMNGEDDRLLVVNLGRDLHLNPAPEPLLGPHEGRLWEVLWSSEDVRYGGLGTPPLDSDENWRIPGHAAVVLKPSNILLEKASPLLPEKIIEDIT
jgi:maltooligosyltrehalose trehalohydrolase